MNNINLKEIGIRIRKQRELLGYTREDLAEMLDVSVKFCSDIELGVKGMSLNTLANISKTLCISTDYILFGESGNNRSEHIIFNNLLIQCPEHLRSNLLTIIRAFINSVK